MQIWIIWTKSFGRSKQVELMSTLTVVQNQEETNIPVSNLPVQPTEAATEPTGRTRF